MTDRSCFWLKWYFFIMVALTHFNVHITNKDYFLEAFTLSDKFH